MIPHVRFAMHAVERYRERVRPGLEDELAALRELKRALAEGHMDFLPEPPAWAEGHEGSAGWLAYGEGIAFPLERGRDGMVAAITCLVRSSIGPGLRAERNRRSARTWRPRGGRKPREGRALDRTEEG